MAIRPKLEPVACGLTVQVTTEFIVRKLKNSNMFSGGLCVESSCPNLYRTAFPMWPIHFSRNRYKSRQCGDIELNPNVTRIGDDSITKLMAVTRESCKFEVGQQIISNCYAPLFPISNKECSGWKEGGKIVQPIALQSQWIWQAALLHHRCSRPSHHNQM